MNDDLKYLKNALGIQAAVAEWSDEASLPFYLKSSAKINVIEACGASFLLARPPANASLPDIKRLYAQLSKRSAIPVAISAPTASARQRHALVAQGIPFVCAGKQASLPFLGTASTEWGKAILDAKSRAKLSPTAQQAAIWGAQQNGRYVLSELRKATGMSASQASDAVSDLVRVGMAIRAKRGRETVVTPVGIDALLGNHMSSLSSPIIRTIFVKKCRQTEALPDAGETALSARGTLNPPPTIQKATSRKMAGNLKADETLEGEFPNDITTHVQIWKYGPLFAGADSIDDISLALSLADSDDERIESEIAALFGKEYPWRKAL